MIYSITKDRAEIEKLAAADERSQEMSDSERDAILESYKKTQNDR